MLRMKKTKVVATISDFRCGEEYIKSLYDAGMDVVRVNSAHVTEESASQIVKNVHNVNPAIPVMIDTKGPEIRVTTIAEEYEGAIEYKVGDRVSVRGTATAEFTRRDTIFMNVPSIVNDMSVGKRMLIADGALEIEVMEKSDDELICEFTIAGVLKSRKSVNVPGVSIALPSITEKDRRFILWAINNDVDFIAHSFVRSAADVKAVQDILDEHNSHIKIISKIENQEGIDNLDEILESSYGIMVARGDLGVELPAEKIPGIQRMIVEKCTAAKRPVIIATQMLYSMVSSARP
ncbi:MAG: pyruvate kinase, partial [Rikenellaceae bacterium]